ncbi:hypothetical protein FRB90_009614 [Tulasnella sp. 427]|nr:hypothetical protein FRB90_009614 [Tulasnella sp. 427]
MLCAAVYVFGTVACGWPGLLNLSIDGVFNTTINRCNCDVVPAGGPGYVCRYPWLAREGLDSNVLHTLSVTLVGPTKEQDPSGQVIAELRSIRYMVPIEPASSSIPADNPTMTDASPTSTVTSIVYLPTTTKSTTAESADSPLPQLTTLHLSTAATCGIIVSVVLFFLLALLICIVLRRRSQQKRRRRQQQSTAAMSNRGSIVSVGSVGRYPTEHLSWSPAAKRMEERAALQQQQQSSRRHSGTSSSRNSWTRRRMDSIPEAEDHSEKPGVDEHGGFRWSAPAGVSAPSPSASGDHWNRRTSRGSTHGGRVPPSPLRRSLIAEDES